MIIIDNFASITLKTSVVGAQQNRLIEGPMEGR